MLVQLVSHVYCPPNLDIYAEHLRWQHAALIHSETAVDVWHTVFCTRSDSATARALEACHAMNAPKNIKLDVRWIPGSHLFRRAIARNVISCGYLTSDRVVHYTDVDYIPGSDWIDSLAEKISPEDSLVIPHQYFINTKHEYGDTMIEENRGTARPTISLYAQSFTARRTTVAIGGIQIIGGKELARIGYLRGTKWVNPVTEEEGFRSCKCDRAWRKHNNLKADKRELGGLYRIRHSCDGRDFNAAGEKLEKAVW